MKLPLIALLSFIQIAVSACAPVHPRIEHEINRLCAFDQQGNLVVSGDPAIGEKIEASLASVDVIRGLGIPNRQKKVEISRSQVEKAFLSATCNTYRDAPALLNTKLKLLSKIHTVAETPEAYSVNKPLWEQLTADGYRKLVELMAAVQQYRPALKDRKDLLYSECDFRFIFRNFLPNNRTIGSVKAYQQFEKEREVFVETSPTTGQCTAEERNTLNIFRGEPTLWPGSPESATMKNAELYYRFGCPDARDEDTKTFCQRIADKPFESRLEMTNQALQNYLQQSPESHKALGNIEIPYVLSEDIDGDGAPETVTFEPNSAGRRLESLFATYLNERQLSHRESSYEAGRLLSREFKKALQEGEGAQIYFSKEQAKYNFAAANVIERRKRLAALFDRHIWYYRLAYISRNNNYIGFLHSPLISSSIYFNQAHKFTFKSYAMADVSEPRMYWMHVIRLKRDQLYTLNDSIRGREPNFAEMWFDEVSLSAESRASIVAAIDKVGYIPPQNIAALLWLGEVKPSKPLLDIVGYKPPQGNAP